MKIKTSYLLLLIAGLLFCNGCVGLTVNRKDSHEQLNKRMNLIEDRLNRIEGRLDS